LKAARQKSQRATRCGLIVEALNRNLIHDAEPFEVAAVCHVSTKVPQKFRTE
jgi:hypothetical protein